MKFAMRDPRTLELLGMNLLVNGRLITWTLVSFFFHNRGSTIQKSLDGMMQEVLHSILHQHPHLVDRITPLYLDLVKSQRTNVPKWDTHTLKNALLCIAQERRRPLRLCLFLDALDEHGGDNEELAMLLKEMITKSEGETVKIKICLASRSWPVFTKHFGKYPGFAIHEHTEKDISIYTQSRLSGDLLGSQHLLSGNQLATLAARVTDMSSGVFIWVRLVVDQLSNDIWDGTPFRDLERRLMETPPELEDLYAHTIRRIKPRYCHECYIMLQIALCSISPLPLETFLECTSYNDKTDTFLAEYDVSYDNHKNNRIPADLPYEGVTTVTKNTSLDSQLRRLASRTGGLLEALSSTPLSNAQGNRKDWQSRGYYVQFIHQTVKEYVLKYQHNPGLVTPPRQMQRKSGYYYLIRPNALTEPWTHPWINPLRPHLFLYAKRLESSIDPDLVPSYVSVLDEISPGIKYDFDLWVKRQNPFRTILESFHDGYHIFFALAIAANLVLYVNASRPPRAPHALLGTTFLRIAAAGPDLCPDENPDHCAMLEALVKGGCNVKETARFLDIQYELHGRFIDEPISPLACLLVQTNLNNRSEETKLQIARKLLNLGAEVNSDLFICESLRGPGQSSVRVMYMPLLEYGVRYGTAPWVTLLLQHSAFSDDYYAQLAYLALLRGDRGVIQALKDHGVPVQYPPRRPHTVGEALFCSSSTLVASLGRPFSGLFRNIGPDLSYHYDDRDSSFIHRGPRERVKLMIQSGS